MIGGVMVAAESVHKQDGVVPGGVQLAMGDVGHAQILDHLAVSRAAGRPVVRSGGRLVWSVEWASVGVSSKASKAGAKHGSVHRGLLDPSHNMRRC